MGVELGVEVARGVVPEGGGHDLLPVDARHLPRLWILHAGFGGVLLDPGKGCRDGAVVGVHDARVAADERGDGDGFRSAEGQVAAGTVQDLAVLAAAPEPGVGAVRHPSFENGPEGVRIDRTLQSELFGALAGPGARLAVLGVVLRIVAVALVVPRALGGGGQRPDREHVSPSRTRGPRPGPRRRRPSPPTR